MIQGKGQAGNVNADEEHETQSSGAGPEGKTHVKCTSLIFFEIYLHKTI